jgi:hypothetical protein
MWRPPPKAINEGFRAMVVLAAILLGFMALRLVVFGLPMSVRSPAMAIGLLAQVAALGFIVWNPKTQLERRYARRMARGVDAGQTFIVRVGLMKGKEVYGTDAGVLTFEAGCLIFRGLTTTFSLPRAQVGLRLAHEGEPQAGVKLLTHVDGESISLNLVEEGQKANNPSLDEAFDRFWRSASSGEFVPPPVTPPPSAWPIWRFPGWRDVLFWSGIYLFVIVQAEVLQANGHAGAQRNLATVFFFTLLAALALEGLRTFRLFRSANRALPSEISPLLNIPTAPLPVDEPIETHLRA